VGDWRGVYRREIWGPLMIIKEVKEQKPDGDGGVFFAK
jgi:hypothetical protein